MMVMSGKLHPLAVQPSLQGQGIGKALVEDFEEQVRARGQVDHYPGKRR